MLRIQVTMDIDETVRPDLNWAEAVEHALRHQCNCYVDLAKDKVACDILALTVTPVRLKED